MIGNKLLQKLYIPFSIILKMFSKHNHKIMVTSAMALDISMKVKSIRFADRQQYKIQNTKVVLYPGVYRFDSLMTFVLFWLERNMKGEHEREHERGT
jgi:hypothetical protein